MSTIDVTTWSLEQTSPDQLIPSAPRTGVHDSDSGPEGTQVRIARAAVPSPEFSRFLYTAVGGDLTWTDRLGWSHARWREFLERPGTETWVTYAADTPAGYIELDAQPDGVVEISYFGLLPAFRGRGLGGALLSHGAARAWDLADRWPERPATRRVWLHTCSKDGPHALANYERRGFRVFETRTEPEPDVPTPGPWPGAFPQA
ncbi:GNAT family N-acetyltransferase [Streptomyces alkaliterrae]|uniref:GNAT family N-acetyltransferase n=1 Tax=Streptomyces alkaliterrae TaxID=2213162 RepID=A0A5P0YQI7_9ACTN|nr:N-acetyltransferase [Streptomyces alkaliterrae]MBB1254100.1 GNAT family N-acetyltransferase [Streptomyces alkaliterrae]MBB1258742.1 GNAT family N-acetyltransferase [Streptomyces alkaliterrae]MQS02518.1 GNAT family N-acetyltransferase [Streptomyces alkaliterrae]